MKHDHLWRRRERAARCLLVLLPDAPFRASEIRWAIRKARDRANVSHPEAWRALEHLKRTGRVEKIGGRTSGTVYRVPPSAQRGLG